jgi:hypothetical protein
LLFESPPHVMMHRTIFASIYYVEGANRATRTVIHWLSCVW